MQKFHFYEIAAMMKSGPGFDSRYKTAKTSLVIDRLVRELIEFANQTPGYPSDLLTQHLVAAKTASDLIADRELIVEPNTDAKTALDQPVVIREATSGAEKAEPVRSVFESNHAEVCDFDDVYNETKNMGGRVIRQNAILFDIENKSKAYAKRLVVPIGCVASEEAEPISIKPGFQKRMQSYQYAIQTGVLSPNEVRMLEGLPVFGGAKQ